MSEQLIKTENRTTKYFSDGSVRTTDYVLDKSLMDVQTIAPVSEDQIASEKQIIREKIAEILSSPTDFVRIGKNLFVNKNDLGGIYYSGVKDGKHIIEIFSKTLPSKESSLPIPVGQTELFTAV